MAIINRDTFEGSNEIETHSFGTIENGTVEVTLRGRTERVAASKWALKTGEIKINVYRVFTGRYNTGTKAWPASVSSDERGEFINFGRDDRAAKFQKVNNLYWAT